jgi:glycosyltransferase involved in cell wall biosynthesis
MGKRMMMGFDRMLFISQNMKLDNINSFSLSPQEYEKRFIHLDWAAETAFYDRARQKNNSNSEPYFITSGQTDRDFDTLIEAFRYVDFKLKIYATVNYKPKSNDIPANVEIYTKDMSSIEIIDLYMNAFAVLICFKKTQKSTLGLTILLDSMAIGKPVIITENIYLDIDVEKEGIGFWVPEGDVQAWVEKIKILIEDPELCRTMGKAALNLQQSKFNMDIFGNSLKKVFLGLKK